MGAPGEPADPGETVVVPVAFDELGRAVEFTETTRANAALWDERAWRPTPHPQIRPWRF